MMGPSVNHLGRANRAPKRDTSRLGTQIARLLAAIGSTPIPEPAPPATAPYDWRDPHTFNADQYNRLTQALGQVAARLAEVFVRAGGGDCKVSLQGCTQHWAGDLCRRPEIDEDVCLAFAPDQGPPCGFVAITAPTARAWATWLLGDSDSGPAPGRALSALEESLLSGLLTAVLDTFLAPLRARHNPGSPNTTERVGGLLQPAGSLCRGQPGLQFELTEEVAQIVFKVKTAAQGQPSAITFLLPCRRLAPLAGKATPTEAPKIPPQELSRALMEHLQDVPVTVTAVLASTTLTFQEVLELSPGDVLLLDKPAAGPAQLILDGRPVFAGRPARAEGKHALVIVASESGPSQPTASASTPANQRKDAKGNA